MLSLLAMLKLVTLKGCFHDIQRNAEQQHVRYYCNKRHRPTFKPALACPFTTRSKTGQSQQHGDPSKYGPRLHPLHQKLNRRQRCQSWRCAKYSTCATGLHFCQYIYIYTPCLKKNRTRLLCLITPPKIEDYQ